MNGLNPDHKSQPGAQQKSKRVAGAAGDVNSAKHQNHEEQNDRERGDQAKLLADDGKDEVGMVLWEEATPTPELLTAVAQTQPSPTAGTKSNHRLISLIARAILALFGMEPGQNPGQPHRIVDEGISQDAHGRQHREG